LHVCIAALLFLHSFGMPGDAAARNRMSYAGCYFRQRAQHEGALEHSRMGYPERGGFEDGVIVEQYIQVYLPRAPAFPFDAANLALYSLQGIKKVLRLQFRLDRRRAVQIRPLPGRAADGFGFDKSRHPQYAPHALFTYQREGAPNVFFSITKVGAEAQEDESQNLLPKNTL
jgi:hypothetical protein